jgi:hypothetical protein
MTTSNQKGSERIRVIFAGGGGSKQSTTATTAINSTAWVDFKDWNRCLCIAFRVTGTGNITANTGVYVSASSTGSSPSAVTTLGATGAMTGVITAARGTILKPNCGCSVFDLSQADVANTLAAGRYISLRYRKKTRANRIACIYVLLDPKLSKASNMLTGINQGSATITAP